MIYGEWPFCLLKTISISLKFCNRIMCLITKLGFTNYMKGAWCHVGVKIFCEIKSTVKEANKSQTKSRDAYRSVHYCLVQ